MDRKNYHTWTREEDLLILSGKYTARELAVMIGVSESAIYARNYKLTGYKPAKIKRKDGEERPENGVCHETCPDYCPYPDCILSSALCTKSNKGTVSDFLDMSELRESSVSTVRPKRVLLNKAIVRGIGGL